VRFEAGARVRAIADRERGNASAPGHVKIMGSVADHQCPARIDVECAHEVHEHVGVGLGQTLVAAARSVKEAAQPRALECTVQTMAAFASGYGEVKAGGMQIADASTRPSEEGELVVPKKVMMPVALSQTRVIGSRELREQIRKGIRQPQSDDVPGSLV